MKNFNESVKMHEEELEKEKNLVVAMSPSQLAVLQIQIIGKLQTIENLLCRIVKEQKIEFKDDEGNTIDLDQYVDLNNSANVLDWLKTFEKIG